MTDYEQVALFHRALADFCRMGLPMGEAFRAVAKDLAGGPLRAEAEEMAAEVEHGMSLGEAWRKRAAMFPPAYGALVEAGVASGDLPGTLEEIARHATIRADADRRVRRALAYPVFMLAAISAIAWFLFRYIVPQFGTIFNQITDKNGNPLELPAITNLLLAISNHGGGLLILGVILAGIFAAAWMRKPLDGIGMTLGLGMRLPFVGAIRLRAALLTFTAALAGLLRRGLPADRALDLAAATADSRDLRRAAAAAAEKVRAGAGLAEATKAAGVYPPTFVWLLGTAERRGEAAAGLSEVERLLRERLNDSLDNYIWVIAPAFQLLLGVLVLAVVMGVFYPILKLQSALM